MAAALVERGVAWPAPLLYAEVTGSTSDGLKRRGVDPWTALRAGAQSGGRGRHGNAWQSPAGNLYISLALPLDLPQGRAPLLSLAASVALAEALEELGVDARLKWPNDVWWRERKLAGVLLEASSSGRGLESLVLGVGLNVAHAPPGTYPAAVCLAEALAAAPTPARVAAALLARISGWYDRVAAAPEQVTAAFTARALDWWGRRVRVREGGRERVGIARGLDAGGALLLETAEGWTAVLAGDAQALRPGE